MTLSNQTTTVTMMHQHRMHKLIVLCLCLAIGISPVTIISAQESGALDGCGLFAYYDDFDLSSVSRQSLEELVTKTHRRQLPYTAASTSSSSGDDVWTALIDLDQSSDDPNSVRMLYSQVDMAASLAGSTDGWNREHLWPQSRGVGQSGMDFTDLHHLRPSEWSINSARGNKFFGDCSMMHDAEQDDCSVPATTGAAQDTAMDATSFLPPAEVRGDIARALLYMDIRYSASNNDGIDLKLSDCPPLSSEAEEQESSLGVGTMAYLSQLLAWHEEDPPSDEEIKRNTKVCYWQGNRNPFVDYPFIVPDLFAVPSSSWPYLCNTTTTTSTSTSTPTTSPVVSLEPATSPSTAPTPTPAPSSSVAPSSTSSPAIGSTCSDLEPGSIMIVGVNSDNPDGIALLALVDIIPSANLCSGSSKNRSCSVLELYLTDNGWDGTNFRSNEGTIKLRLTKSMIRAGQVFGFGRDDFPKEEWEHVSGSFALARDGDGVFVYCLLNDNTDNQSIHFIAGFAWNTNSDEQQGGAWVDRGDSGSSALPDSLRNVAVYLDSNDFNHVYVGPTTSESSSELLQQIIKPSTWESRSSERYNLSSLTFEITTTTAISVDADDSKFDRVNGTGSTRTNSGAATIAGCAGEMMIALVVQVVVVPLFTLFLY